MKCVHCHCELLDGEVSYTTTNNKHICADCIDLYYKCDECGKYFKKSSVTGVCVGDLHVCRTCLNVTENDHPKYYRCTRCGKYYKYGEGSTYNGLSFCNDCYYIPSEHGVNSYHSHHGNTLAFNVENSTSKRQSCQRLYLGVELEVDSSEYHPNLSEVSNSVKAMFPDKFIMHERDGSLDNGFENITQPATLGYHESLKNGYCNMFKYLISSGYRSHKTSTCGMHVHFNRSFFRTNEDVYVARLLELTSRFWPQLVKWSRRKGETLNRWAAPYTDEPQSVVRESKGGYVSRYHAINLSNEKTIEFRLFRGTLKWETYLATLCLVDRMVRVCKEIESNEDFQNLTWEELIGTRVEMLEYWETVKDRT